MREVQRSDRDHHAELLNFGHWEASGRPIPSQEYSCLSIDASRSRINLLISSYQDRQLVLPGAAQVRKPMLDPFFFFAGSKVRRDTTREIAASISELMMMSERKRGKISRYG
jgi:hypothetical protein